VIPGGDVLRVRVGRASTGPGLLANYIKELDRNQTSSALERVACLIPLRIIFAVNNMQKVALREAEVSRIWSDIVVECFDDLRTG
jgi:hypothetical protein